MGMKRRYGSERVSGSRTSCPGFGPGNGSKPGQCVAREVEADVIFGCCRAEAAAVVTCEQEMGQSRRCGMAAFLGLNIGRDAGIRASAGERSSRSR